MTISIVEAQREAISYLRTLHDCDDEQAMIAAIKDYLIGELSVVEETAFYIAFNAVAEHFAPYNCAINFSKTTKNLLWLDVAGKEVVVSVNALVKQYAADAV